MLLSLFAGIEAVRRALDLLGLVPLRHVSVEIDLDAHRNTAEVYPDAVHVGDIRDVTETLLEKYFGRVEALFVLCVGGSPCQDLSGLNAPKGGDSRCPQLVVL